MEPAALAPRVPAGTTADCRRLTTDELRTREYLGHAVILQRGQTKSLEAAWHLGERTFQCHGVPFTLPADGNVYGVISWIMPTLYDADASSAMSAARPPSDLSPTREAP